MAQGNFATGRKAKPRALGGIPAIDPTKRLENPVTKFLRNTLTVVRNGYLEPLCNTLRRHDDVGRILTAILDCIGNQILKQLRGVPAADYGWGHDRSISQACRSLAANGGCEPKADRL